MNSHFAKADSHYKVGNLKMTYEESLSYINSLLVFGSKPGLERISTFLEKLNNPQNDLKFVHIAGTNGKGSTSTMCANSLTDAGYKTGLYISPFVNDFRERIQINGEMISKERLCEIVDRLKPICDDFLNSGNVITEFEFITALAFIYYKEEKCDIVCLEVGLGGRFDATNVINTPLVSVITSIGLDHTAILGDTVEKIAMEKCGIIKNSVPVVCYPDQPSGVLGTVIETAANNRSALYIPAPPHHSEIESDTAEKTAFRFSSISFDLKMHGHHQLLNAITATQALLVLRTQGFEIPNSSIESGVSRASLPARIEKISEQPLVIVDGAHNPAGIDCLCETVKTISNRPIVLVMGMLKDKDVVASLSKIAPLCQHFIAVEPNNPRKMSSQELCMIASKHCEAECAETYDFAAARAVKLAGENGAVISCGSLYMANDMRISLEKALNV